MPMNKILSSGCRAAVTIAAAALLAFSCTKDNQGGGEGSIPEVLGTYEFDGDVYDILTASFERSETFLTFVFSPLYGEGLSTYLAFAVDKLANYCSTINTYANSGGFIVQTFSRQALPMKWDYAESKRID